MNLNPLHFCTWPYVMEAYFVLFELDFVISSEAGKLTVRK